MENIHYYLLMKTTSVPLKCMFDLGPAVAEPKPPIRLISSFWLYYQSEIRMISHSLTL